MLFNTVAFSVLLLGSATATIVHERSLEDGVSALYKRQYQFQPGTQTATGNTCADAFGSGYTICREATGTQNRLCYNPNAGQTCCSSTWACPNGSACSAGNYCCPNGQDAKSCAAANVVSSSSSSSAWYPSSSSSTSTYYSSSTVSSTVHKTTTKTKSYSTPSAYNYVVPSSYAVKNVTSAVYKASATATGAYTVPTTTKAPVFQGAASELGMSFSGLMGAGIVGVVAALL